MAFAKIIAAPTIAIALAGGPTFRSEAMPRCVPMELPVLRIEPAPGQYAAFCARHPSACDLSGDAVIAGSEILFQTLGAVNARVNGEIELVSDMDNLGLEEDWDFPRDCRGDCEDFALEKRERLVAGGVPRAALTVAFAFHEVQLFAHAVLLVETTWGTWVLDNLHDEVLCWDAVPYAFTRREMPDGQWQRFTPFMP